MGPQGKLVVGNSRYTAIPGSEVDQQMGGKERLLSSNGSGSVSGSPGRLHDNVSRDSGIGCLKVNIPSICSSQSHVWSRFACFKSLHLSSRREPGAKICQLVSFLGNLELTCYFHIRTLP